MATTKLVVMESPYAGDTERNVRYARAAMRDCLLRNEAPMAGHLLYTQVLNDTVDDQRATGIRAHMAWIKRADALVVYQDLGMSNGMLAAIDRAAKLEVPIEYRTLPGWISAENNTNG